MGETFEVELSDGTKKQAKFLTRIQKENSSVEYMYYSIEDGDTDNESIFSSKIVIEDGKEVMKNLETEEERQDAYKVFSETYKNLRQQDK